MCVYAGQRNASTHFRAPLILLDLLEIYFPHVWAVVEVGLLWPER